MKHSFTILILLVQGLGVYLYAQQADRLVYGNIPNEYLTVEQIQPFPDAPAVVLLHKGQYTFSGDFVPAMTYVDHKQIKIFDAREVDFEMFDLYLPPGESFRKIRANVVYPDGKYYKLSQKEIITYSDPENGTDVYFNWPNLVDGCILEYMTVCRSNYVEQLDDWIFQSKLPTLQSILQLSLPIDVNYNIIPFHTEMLPDTVVTDTKFGQVLKVSSWNAMNVPAIAPETILSNPMIYYPRLSFYFLDYAIRTPDAPYTTTWSEQGMNLMEAEYFGKLLEDSKVFNALISNQDGTNNNLSLSAQILFVKNLIQNRIKWNKEYSIYPSSTLEEVIQFASGNSADMNLLAIGLLRSLNIPAYPVMIRTRDLGPVERKVPELNQFNHFLIFSNIDSMSLLLDFTTDKKIIDPIIAVDDGLIIGDDRSFWISMDLSKATDQYDTNVKVDSQLLIVHTAHNAKGQSAKELMDDYIVDSSGYISVDRFLSIAPRSEVQGFRKKATDISFHTEIDAIVYNHITQSDNVFTIAPLWNSELRKIKLDSLNNPLPIELSNTVELTEKIMYTFPDDAKNIVLPDSVTVNLQNGDMRFSLQSAYNEDIKQATLILEIYIDAYYFKPSDYNEAKQFFDVLGMKLMETVRFER